MGMVTAEKNTNPFANGNAQNVCGDASLPVTPELRGITPLIDPDVDADGAAAALSKSSAAAPLTADGLSVFDLMDQAGLGDLVKAQGGAGGAAAGGAAQGGNQAAGNNNANQNQGNAAQGGNQAAAGNNQNNNQQDAAAGQDNAAADNGVVDCNDAGNAAQDNNAAAGGNQAANNGTAAAGNDNANQNAGNNANNNQNQGNAAQGGNQAAAGNNNQNQNANQGAANNQDQGAAAGNNNQDAAAGGAAGGAAAGGAADFGKCTPTIIFAGGQNGRPADEFTFQIEDPLARGGQGEALNPDIITNALCNQLTNVCDANAAGVAACKSAQAAVKGGPRDQTTADKFNSLITGGGAAKARKMRRGLRML
jgi:hypothetical protein